VFLLLQHPTKEPDNDSFLCCSSAIHLKLLTHRRHHFNNFGILPCQCKDKLQALQLFIDIARTIDGSVIGTAGHKTIEVFMQP
jgi:hypothetical protein